MTDAVVSDFAMSDCLNREYTAYAALVIRSADWISEFPGERQEVKFKVERKSKGGYNITVDRETKFLAHRDGEAFIRYYRKPTGRSWYYEAQFRPTVFKDCIVTITPSPGFSMEIKRNPTIKCDSGTTELRK